MDLTSYVERLRHELALAAGAGGDDARVLADRLTAPLDSAARLVLLEALSAAADEITRELAPGSVDVRLRGHDPSFVVVRPTGDEPAATAAAAPAEVPDGDEGATVRVNLRLPDTLKTRIEDAAARERISLNAWIVRAAGAALAGQAPLPSSAPRGSGQHLNGWVR